MPKRKWNRLHDDPAIDDERRHRSLRLGEQQEARATVDEAVADLLEQSPVAPPAEPEPGDKPPVHRRKKK